MTEAIIASKLRNKKVIAFKCVSKNPVTLSLSKRNYSKQIPIGFDKTCLPVGGSA